VEDAVIRRIVLADKMNSFESFVELDVGVFAKRVQVRADCSREENGML
jgi:hypothetical protein